MKLDLNFMRSGKKAEKFGLFCAVAVCFCWDFDRFFG